MNRATFFKLVREQPFTGRLAQTQVNGMNAILDEWENRSDLNDSRWLAYILGTTYHESAHTMQPIEEIGRGGIRPYAKTPYYGRGLVQMTLKDNYRKMGELLNVDLLNHPEKACEMPIAVKVLFEGMIRGMFTGHKLNQYFNGDNSDWYNARWIVNSKWDRAEDISHYSRAFLFALDFAFKDEQQAGRSMEQQVDITTQEGEMKEIYRQFGYGATLLNLDEDEDDENEDY